MAWISRILDWLRYERLHHYPVLAHFDRESALKRLKKYEAEERAARRSSLRLFLVIMLAACALLVTLTWAGVIPLVLFWPINLGLMVLGWMQQYFMHRRIARRVNAKIEAELAGGRLVRCCDCGYDVRASGDRCSECGASIVVGPPEQ